MKKSYILTLFALLLGAGASAQIQSTYFLDNFTYSYRNNPAIMTSKSFVGLGFSNIGLGADGNIGLSSILFKAPSGNGLVTGFHSGVSADDFLSGINDRNTVSGDFDLNIFSLGLRRKNTMTTIELNSRTFADATVSGELFRFLKLGGENVNYDFSSTDANIKSYVELAVGRSRRIGDNLSFGYRIKGLMGIGGVYATLNDANASLSGSQIDVTLKGNAGVAGNLFQFKTGTDGKISGLEEGSGFGAAGFGAAVDAGVNWKPMESLTVSASLTDLGLLSWKYSSLAEANNTVNYKGVDISGENSKFEDELEKVLDDFKDLASFRKKSGEESSADMLPFRINAGVRYQIPGVKSLSASALFSYKNSALPVADLRAAVTYTPKDWFSISGNLGGNSLGMVWGGALSLCSSHVNFFFGFDACAVAVSPDLIPLEPFSFRMNLGLVFRFGELFD